MTWSDCLVSRSQISSFPPSVHGIETVYTEVEWNEDASSQYWANIMTKYILLLKVGHQTYIHTYIHMYIHTHTHLFQ